MLKTSVVKWAIAFSVLLLAVAGCTSGVAVNTPPPSAVTTAPTKDVSSPQSDWEKTVALARQEGQIFMVTTASASTREALAGPLKSKYGIDLEFIVGSGGDLSEKVAAQRRAGLFFYDFYLGGATTATTTMKPAGFLDPLKPLLVLPEVTDPKAWYGGGINYADKEGQFIACSILMSSNKYLSVNSDLVKPGEIKSYKDLLDPKWKGKIIMYDPTIAGAASRWVAVVADKYMGSDFMVQFAKNEPVITRDYRLQIEGTAKGKYLITIGSHPDILAEFMKLGAPLKPVMPAEGAFLTGGSGLVSYLNKAAHPNASKVFINWFLSKEGQTYYSRSILAQSARVDVPTDHLDKDDIRDPNVKYFVSEEETFLIKIREYQEKSKVIFKSSLQ